MNFEELLAKYQAILLENANLKRQIELLKAASITADSKRQEVESGFAPDISGDSSILFSTENPVLLIDTPVLRPAITNLSEPAEKIKLFMALFRGRDDVYAKRWESSKKGTSGYSPVCLNEWKIGLCKKPVGKCIDCAHKSYMILDERVIDEHLRGRGNFVAGIYPLCQDETCYFLAIDFDDGDWQKDILKLSHGNEFGILKNDEEEIQKPWETSKIRLLKTDFPQEVEIVRANMLFILKAGISQRALDRLKRLAAFKNPEFFQAQALRLSTSRIPRIISCAEETSEFLCLPRGCEPDLKAVLAEASAEAKIIDKTKFDIKIDVEFRGQLREEQPKAVEQLLKNDIGVLSGTTAFEKTIVAIKLIVERKVNTLILVDKVNLVSQWQKRLLEFLTINETLPDIDAEMLKKRGRKTARSLVGQIGGGKNNLNGIVDIAVMQSLYHGGEVKECIKNYGMIIVDECHHVSAFSFESILKSAMAKYVYGLTATPARKDGHHPIIFMQCGPIRYRDNAKKQAENRPFEHYVIPRFTSLNIPLGLDDKDVSIQELFSEVVVNTVRNELIVADVNKSHANGRNCVVLTERTAHVETLAKAMKHLEIALQNNVKVIIVTRPVDDFKEKDRVALQDVF